MLIRKILRAAAFCLTFIILMYTINFIFWDDIHSLSRLTMSEMYNYNGNIDTVVLGSSYVVHGFNPKIADEVSGAHTYNAATKLQAPDGSYYMLKEIIKHHKVSTVYIDCNNVIMSQFKSVNYGANSIISVYMKPSLDKYRFVYESGGGEALLKNAFPFLIRKKLNFIPIIKAKLTDGYKPWNYRYVNLDDEEYAGLGYVIKDGVMKDDDNYESIWDIDPSEPLTEFSRYNLKRIADLCRRNNIRLVLMTVPVASEMVRRTDNVQVYIDAVQAFADENNIEYHNYNLARSRYCSMKISDYSDKEHLNDTGAANFTRQFMQTEAALADGTLTKADVFYDTISDKMEYDPGESVRYYRDLKDKHE